MNPCETTSALWFTTPPYHADTIKQKLVYGTAYDTLVESRSIVRRVHMDIYGESDGPLQLSVSYDGSWKTRGFHSPFGVGFVIEVLTGLVIYAIRSKYCVECTRWEETEWRGERTSVT